MLVETTSSPAESVNWMVWLPIAKVLVVIGPEAYALVEPSSNQVKEMGSFSGSVDPEATKMTVAVRRSAAMTTRLVWFVETRKVGEIRTTGVGRPLAGMTVRLTVATAEVSTPAATSKLKLSVPM